MLQDVKAPARGADRPPTRIQSVSRAVEVLRYVADQEDAPATLSRIAAAVGTPLPTAYHLLATLVDEGMLVRDPKRGYRLGSTVGLLGDAFRREPAIPDGLLDPLRKLAVATGEASFLSGWQDGEVTLLRAEQGRFGFRVPKVAPGFTAFAHARAAGKLLLAFLPDDDVRHYLDLHPLRPLTPRTIVDAAAFGQELAEIRASGCAVDDEEFMDGMGCVSAAARDGETVLAYSVAAPVERFRVNRDRFIRATRSAARIAEAFWEEAAGENGNGDGPLA
jgi:IclR family transcriptional regulator, acetate operon repressor